MFNIKVLESNFNIKKQILEAVREELNTFYNERILIATPIVRQRFLNFCHGSSIFDKLATGKIVGEIGLPYGLARTYVYDVFQKASEQLEIQYIQGNKKSLIDLYFKEGWQEALLSSYPIMISETKREELPWLKWLLEEGSKAIIKEYVFYDKPGYGRSQEGIMISVKGGTWGIIDSTISGTKNDNFLTRLFEEFSQELELIYKEIFDV